MKQLVIGWGNPIAGDDGIGPRAAELILKRVPADIHVLSTSYAGLRLVETMRGYDRVIVADVYIADAESIRTDIIRPHDLGALDHPVRHDSTLIEALHVFRAMNDSQLPEEVILISVPISAPLEWKDELSSTGESAAERLCAAVVHELEEVAAVV